MSRSNKNTIEQFVAEDASDAQPSIKEKSYRIIDEYFFATFRVLWNDYRARIGLLILLFYGLLGTAGVWLLPPPEYQGTEKYLKPFVNMEYPLGADHQGRALLRQTIHSIPSMIKMILAGAVFSTGLATIVGTVMGYKGGSIDRVLMYVVDMTMSIPTLPLVIVLAAVFEPSDPILVGLMLSVTAWAGLSRTIRAQVLALREEPYIEASRTMGLPATTVLLKDVTPNVMPYIMVHFVQAGRNIIFSSVALYFLGFLPYGDGATKNWGVQLDLAFSNNALANPDLYYWFAVPMIAIGTLSYGLIMLGQGTDRIFNPRIRARHAKTVEDEQEFQQ